MKKLSVCMIVKNEEPVLGRCLSCVVRFADELIVVDTGSTDRSVEIAREYTPLVYHHPWQNSFAEARNYSYSKATGDYIMWIDADDVVSDENIASLNALKAEEEQADMIYIRYRYFSESGLTAHNMRHRIVRSAAFTGWRYDIHEKILPEPHWKELYRPDIEILHKKEYVNEPKRNIDIFDRLLKEGKPLSLREKEYLVVELSAHQRTDEALSFFRKFRDDLPLSGYENSLDVLATELCRAKRFQECLDLLLCAEEQLPPTARRMWEKGMCFEGLGDDTAAEAAYRSAMAITEDPETQLIHYDGYNDYYPYLRLAAIAERRGDQNEALRLLNEAGKRYPRAEEWQQARLRIILGTNKPESEKKADREKVKTEKELEKVKAELEKIKELMKSLSPEELEAITGGESLTEE